MSKVLVIVIDGCALEYLSEKITPNMMTIGEKGFFKTIKSAIPSVTNVNHATILTGSFPNEHGVVGNYFYNRETKEHGFIEDPSYLKKESVFDVYAAHGVSTALLAVKGKVVEVFGSHAGTGISLERPDESLLNRLHISNPPEVYSLDANAWIFNACFNLIEKDNPDFVYCTTNDFMMHNFAPDTQEAKLQMSEIDKWIGRIYELDPSREIYITADHGMNEKSRLINMQKKLENAGFDVVCLPPIKDRYLENHRYQEGGVLYLYLQRPEDEAALIDYLKTLSFIENVYTKEEAAETFMLPIDNIGDLLITADFSSAFAETEGEELYVNVRTHGSLHEQKIPLIAVNARRPAESYVYNRDIVKYLLEDLKSQD